ncbi:CpaE family protein [Nocardioides sp.]|uniref:AAA family ATPase n=1 Tax=Nocardioides sp. TaxID=35761 RepID=UPI003527F6F1
MQCVLMVASGAAWEPSVFGRLAGRGDVVVLKRCVDVDDLLATAAAGQAQVAVVAAEAPGLDAAAVELLRRDQVRLVAVAADIDDEELRLRAARAGVAVLVAADDLDGLVRAVTDPPEEPAAVEPADPPDDDTAAVADGRVLAVWGPQGAPGRTTVAVTTAAVLAARGRRTVLVDADPYGGAIATQLGVVDEMSGLLAAARLAATGALADRFAGVQRRVDAGLYVVTGLPRADRWAEVRPAAVEQLLEVARRQADVVVDTGFSLEQESTADFSGRPGRNAMTLAALDAADDVVVVGAADPVGLTRLARGLVELREVVGDRPLHVVVNRSRGTLGWSEREVAGMVEGFARVASLHFLPDDTATVDRALLAGRSLAELGDSPVRRGVEELVDALVPGDPRGGRRVRRRRAGRARRR